MMELYNSLMNTTERVIAILKYIATSNTPVSVSEICKELRLSKNNVFRVTAALAQEGWIEHNQESKKFTLTGAMVGLGFKALSRLDINNISAPYLFELQEISGETSTLSLRLGLERMFINQVPSSHEIRHVVQIGKRVELWYGASGKAILAFLNNSQLEEVLQRFVQSGDSILASGQAITPQTLKAQLEIIRARGYEIAISERVSGVCSVAAPIWGTNSEVIGSIAVAGPMPRFNQEQAQEVSAAVKKAAASISSIMGAS
jgi:IclR family acetate operon transcriptional repressor